MSSPELLRLARIARRFRREFKLDLSNTIVLTEAATGPFSVTAALAALAGARVYAVARTNRYASARKSREATSAIATKLQVKKRIQYIANTSLAPLQKIDIVTNSGNVRPVSPKILAKLPSHAVVSLMVEPWEVRKKDVDLQSAKKLGIVTAGCNERGRKVAVFHYLGSLLLHVLQKNKLSYRKKRVMLLCSNPFHPFLTRSVRSFGGFLTRKPELADLVVIATGPTQKIPKSVWRKLPRGVPIIQIWGNVSNTVRKNAFRWYPRRAPRPGHMGYLLSELGAEPAVRLIAAGLKVGQLLSRSRISGLNHAQSRLKAVKSGFALSPSRW